MQLAQPVLIAVREDIARSIVVKYILRIQKRAIIMSEGVLKNGVYFRTQKTRRIVNRSVYSFCI